LEKGIDFLKKALILYMMGVVCCIKWAIIPVFEVTLPFKKIVLAKQCPFLRDSKIRHLAFKVLLRFEKIGLARQRACTQNLEIYYLIFSKRLYYIL
jgi:hypothetical protein